MRFTCEVAERHCTDHRVAERLRDHREIECAIASGARIRGNHDSFA
jgi:hypothetical protein